VRSPPTVGGLALVAWETVRKLIVAAVGGETFQPGNVCRRADGGDLGDWDPHAHAIKVRPQISV
jgi:hypothetical protein